MHLAPSDESGVSGRLSVCPSHSHSLRPHVPLRWEVTSRVFLPISVNGPQSPLTPYVCHGSEGQLTGISQSWDTQSVDVFVGVYHSGPTSQGLSLSSTSHVTHGSHSWEPFLLMDSDPSTPLIIPSPTVTLSSFLASSQLPIPPLHGAVVVTVVAVSCRPSMC